jgi:hypothetical protein
MREIAFNWKGETLRLTPSMLLLSRLANEVRRGTEGSETTVSIAYKCVHGGLEPLYLMIPLREFIREAISAIPDRQLPTDDEIMSHALSAPADILSFRMAYVNAVLPHVELGKGPAGPSSAQGEASKPAKPGGKKRSTSRSST